MKHNPRIKGIYFLLVLALVVSVGVVVYRQYQWKQAEDDYRQVRQEEKTISESKTPSHDFDKLQKINKDIYGWICVDGTRVDYPVLQGSEDNFYLTHDMNGEKSQAGAIYTNSCNRKDMTDGMTILYGHDMKADTMFGSLHYFDDKSFFEENKCMTFENRQGRYEYEIIGVYNYSDDYLPAAFDVNNADGVLMFWDSLKRCQELADEITHVRADVEVTESDKLLVLSTCIPNQEDRRFLVVGKLSQYVDYE